MTEKFIKCKKNRRKIAAIMLVSLLLTGCETDISVFDNYEIPLSQNSEQDISDGTTADNIDSEFLSANICVVPKKKQSQKDSFMTAGASLIFDNTHNKMLYADNIYTKMYPASTTKIVTALVALKYGNLNDEVTISYNATHINEYGAKLCGFAEGDKITLKKLLYSFLICSGNDAGIAIAEHIAGSVDKFAAMMNKEVTALGCSGSNFVNPHGLHDDNHYTTPYDLYLVFHELLKYDVFMDIINHSSYKAEFNGADGNKKTLWFTSTDKYLLGSAKAPEGVTVIGGKTGTTSMAGSNLILYSKNSNGNSYISVVMHASDSFSLYSQMSHLLELENQ